MNITVDSLSISPLGTATSCKINIEIPKKCPICETAYLHRPEVVRHFDSGNNFLWAYAIFFCPHCEDCFFVSYLVPQIHNAFVGQLYAVYPVSSSKTTFSTQIELLSPDFVKIYNQSEQAENQNLSEICGMGYRKALEFLIKDYLCSIHPEQCNSIESLPLAKCIANYIQDERVRILATASAWLGNDETHYVHKHPNYNVQDLKRFINTVVAFIDYELNLSEARKLLSAPQ